MTRTIINSAIINTEPRQKRRVTIRNFVAEASAHHTTLLSHEQASWLSHEQASWLMKMVARALSKHVTDLLDVYGRD